MREAINFLLLLFVFLIGISSFPQNVKKNSVGEEKVTKMIKSLGRMFNWTIYLDDGRKWMVKDGSKNEREKKRKRKLEEISKNQKIEKLISLNCKVLHFKGIVRH